MPLSLIPPREGRSKVYRVRGLYLGRYVDRTTETADKKVARLFLKAILEQIERGQLASKDELTFAEAALSYAKAGGEQTYLKPIVDYFGPRMLVRNMTQAVLDEAAAAIYPRVAPSTRNREFYTPVSAILRHAGIQIVLRRPKGSQGTSRLRFLSQDEAGWLLAAARAVDEEFSIFLTLLLYTGLRLSEGLRLLCRDIDLSAATAFAGRTKNGLPRSVHLPPQVIAELANHPRGLARDGKAFRFTKGGSKGELYGLLERALLRAGIQLERGTAFHVLRHTYGAWLRRFAGLDTSGLVATGAWASRSSAALYEHADVSAEARRADLLPNVVRRG